MKQADQERLESLLHEQVDFLDSSCLRYDHGSEHEAKRIALCIRVLLHDTQRSRSLLGQLGLKSRLGFVDTAQEIATEKLDLPLGVTVVDMGESPPRYLPYFDACGWECVGFDGWWNRTLVRPVDHRRLTKDGMRAAYTRRDFVLGLANKDGGAHVDPHPEDDWRSLRDESFLGALSLDSRPIGNLVPATLRQIGWELLVTLDSAELPISAHRS